MARLRIETRTKDGAGHARDETTGYEAMAASSASSAFAGTGEMPQPLPIVLSRPHEQTANPLDTKRPLMLKTTSPIQTARKQVLLKPMKFTTVEDDLSILTARRDLEDEIRRRRRRPRGTAFYPTKSPSRTSGQHAFDCIPPTFERVQQTLFSLPRYYTPRTLTSENLEADRPIRGCTNNLYDYLGG